MSLKGVEWGLYLQCSEGQFILLGMEGSWKNILIGTRF